MRRLPKIEVHEISKWYGFSEMYQPRVQDSIVSAFRRLSGKTQAPAAAGEGDGFWALRDVSFSLELGERVGIVGLNGSGKSTLLKILSRITVPSSGTAVLRGKVSSLLEMGAGLHPDVSGRENIYLYGSILGMTKAEIDERLDAIVEFSGVERFLDMPVKRYSSGMYARLAFSVAAHLKPDILMLDEVLAVGDPLFQERCRKKLACVVREGVTLLLVSHNLDEVARLCHRVIRLENGRIAADGRPAEVLKPLRPAFAQATLSQ
jgi:lipopolysaccharide transport system ATP-binding protein